MKALPQRMDFRFRGNDGRGVGSRFRGNDVVAWGDMGTGRVAPVLALSRRLDSRLRGNDAMSRAGYNVMGV